MAWEVRNEAFGLGFFMFFIGAKNKKSNFFFEMISNHSKMVPNTPKLYLNVILVCFTVIGGLISVILTILVIFGQKINMSMFETCGVTVGGRFHGSRSGVLL